MTLLAPALQAFFTERLITQRNSSPQTIAAYRDTFRLLLAFAQKQTAKQPFQLDIDDLDAPLIGAFLNHLEEDRGNSPRTRNARLGAIHSFYRYVALGHPEHAHTIARVMAIPTKRHERNTVSYLDLDEIKALLAAPDRGTWLGRRDHALLVLMIQTGVRVSELAGLRGPRRPPRHRLPHPDPRQGTQEALNDADPRDRRDPAPMGHRTPRRARRPAVPDSPRPAAQPLHRRAARLKARCHGSGWLPLAEGQARHPARAPPHQRDAPQSQGRRHRDDRAVARP
jgi:integrase